MKEIKKISITILIVMISLCFNITKVEAASISFSASSQNVTVGTTVTLTATVTAGAWNLSINGNGVNKKMVGNFDASYIGNKTVSESVTFTPQAPGTYTFNLKGDITDFDTEKAENVSKPITITVNPKEQSGGSNTGGSGNSGSQDKPDESNVPSESNNNKPKQEVTKSSNNSLKELSIGTGKLTPEFSRDTYEYSVEFDDTVNLYDLSEIEVSATAEDEKASVRGTGKIQLTEGENNIAINVTAENGAVRTYTIKVNKPQKVEQSALRLKTLVLNGINKNGEYQTINFDLDPETFEYNLTVPNEITAISINPTTENEDIIIETNGSDSLNEGKNKIVIILTSPSDNTITTTYTLNIERQAAIVENNDAISKEQIIYMAIAGGIVLIILIIIIVAIIKHKKKKQLYDYDEEDEEDIPFASNETIKDFENNTLSEEKTTEPIEEEKELKTTDDVAPSKLKWADFCEAYEDEEKIEDKQKKDKNKGGKRFL